MTVTQIALEFFCMLRGIIFKISPIMMEWCEFELKIWVYACCDHRVDVYIALSWERALKEKLHLYFILLFLYTLEHRSLAMAQVAAHFTGCLYCS